MKNRSRELAVWGKRVSGEWKSKTEHTDWKANTPAPETDISVAYDIRVLTALTVYSQSKIDPLFPNILQ